MKNLNKFLKKNIIYWYFHIGIKNKYKILYKICKDKINKIWYKIYKYILVNKILKDLEVIFYLVNIIHKLINFY